MIVRIDNRLESTVYVTAARTTPGEVEILISPVERIGIVGEPLYRGRIRRDESLLLRGFLPGTHFAASVTGFGDDVIKMSLYEGTNDEGEYARLSLDSRVTVDDCDPPLDIDKPV